ncbi:MAG: metallophosphoesterase [Candidatus Binatia bacterium]
MRRLAILSAFFALLIAVLIGGHFYLAMKLALAPAWPEPWRAIAIAVLALGMLAIVLQPVGERLLAPTSARWIAWPASLWMGGAFFLLLGALVSDALLAAIGAVSPGAGAGGVGAARLQAAGIIAFALAASGFGFQEARRAPRLQRVTVDLPRWPPQLDGFRIVQISDLHIGPILDRRFATELTERVNDLVPDLIAVTGDLVDGAADRLRDEVAPLAELRAAHGVFFVTGNHDYYSGADAWVARVRELGMIPLRNARVAVQQRGGVFDLAGVEDHHAHLVNPAHRCDLDAALAGRDPARPVVLLAHDPLTFKRAAAAGVDLQLSGHTHGGQLWPFRYFVRMTTPFVAGYYRLREAQLYVSRGSGFWGPAMRLFTPAEITEITLRRGRTAACRAAAAE